MKRTMNLLGVGVSMLAGILAGGAIVAGSAQPVSAASRTATLGAGNVLINWSIPNAPAGGLTNITFPITVNAATVHADGTYFAQQYGFTNAPNRGYTGLQPRPDSNGRQRMHAVFSSFIAGSTSTDGNCHDGADTWAGVSCAVDFDGVYGRRYDITVEQTGTDTWSGTVHDTVTGNPVHIGTYQLPAGSGKLKSSEDGFVEYYLGTPSCAEMPKIDVVFGAPSSTSGGGPGKSVAVREYSGDCLGNANYTATSAGDTVRVTRGFVPSGDLAGPIRGLAGKCLDVAAAGLADGTAIQLYGCNGTGAQQWTLRTDHTIQALGKCLDVAGAGTADGTTIQLYTCNGTAAQQWVFTQGNDLVNPHADKCLDVAGANTADGARVQLYTCNGTASQKWVVPTS